MAHFNKRFEQMKMNGILPRKPVIVECGANVGTSTDVFLRYFPGCKMFCFEPDPRCIEHLKTMPFIDQVVLYETVVSDIDGTILLRQSSGSPKKDCKEHWGGNTIKGIGPAIEAHSWIKYLEPIEVKSTRLDTWFKDSGVDKIDFMWTDVEGAEEELIRGGLRTLENTHYFYSEYVNKHSQGYEGRISLAEMTALLPNFERVQKWGCDVLFRNRYWK